VLGGEASWDAVSEALVEHREFLRRFVAEQRVQTNEVQRCWTLLPCFLEAARRAGAETLDLIELGPSAGLNLVWDRYRYHYADANWGSAASPLELRGEERRHVPRELLGLKLHVRSRIGIDIAPLDATTGEGARLLRSFVWPDQSWRLEQLDRAVEAVRRDPPELRRDDLVDALPDLLESRRDDALTLVWQSSVLGYLTPERRGLVYETLNRAGERGRLAFVSLTRPADGLPTYYGLFMQLWPDGERVEVAHADFHGAWLEWLL
jgi:hypothetical protein